MVGLVDSWKVYITVGAVLLAFILLSIIWYDMDRRDDYRLTHNIAPGFTSPLPSHDHSLENISAAKAIHNALSPYFRSSSTFWQRYWGEAKIHHLYINVFLRYVREFSRPLRGAVLLLRILIVFSVLAAMYSNNSLCDHPSSQIDCEDQWLTSWTDNTVSVCGWEESRDGGNDHCRTGQVGGNLQLALKIALVSAVLCILPALLLNWLFIHILAADSKPVSSTRVSALDDQSADDISTSHRSVACCGDRRGRLDLLERKAESILGCSVAAEVEHFHQEFRAYADTRTRPEASQLREAWKEGSRKGISHDICKTRRLTVQKVHSFEKDHSNELNISDQIFIIFMKEMTSGITRQIIHVKHQQGRMKAREVHFLLKIFVALFVGVLGIGMVIFLFLFAHQQDTDRQRAWFLSALLWLGTDIALVSPAVVLLQHIAIPSLATADVNRIVRDHFTDGNESDLWPHAAEMAAGTDSVPISRTVCFFNAGAFVFLSHRLASLYPGAPAGRVLSKHSTPWPRGAWQHVGNVKKNRGCGFGCLYAWVLIPMLSLLLHLPLLVQETIFQIISTIAVGVLLYVHAYLYNISPALIAGPLSVVVLIWIVNFLRTKKIRSKVTTRSGDHHNQSRSPRAKKHSTSTVVEVAPLDLEAGARADNVSISSQPLIHKKETTKKSVKFCIPVVYSSPTDAESLPVVDLDTQHNALLSRMSSNMDDFESYIVQDVLQAAVTEVHKRGMDYIVEREERKWVDVNSNEDGAELVTPSLVDSPRSLGDASDIEGSSNLSEEGSVVSLDHDVVDGFHSVVLSVEVTESLLEHDSDQNRRSDFERKSSVEPPKEESQWASFNSSPVKHLVAATQTQSKLNEPLFVDVDHEQSHDFDMILMHNDGAGGKSAEEEVRGGSGVKSLLSVALPSSLEGLHDCEGRRDEGDGDSATSNSLVHAKSASEDTSEHALLAKSFIDSILCDQLRSFPRDQTQLVPSGLLTVSPPSDSYESTQTFTATFLSSPQAKRKKKLLYDAEKIVSLSHSKTPSSTGTSGIDVIDSDAADIDILPVFSAWCDDVIEELNIDNHPERSPMKRGLSARTGSSLIYEDVESPAKVQEEQQFSPDYKQAFSLLSSPRGVTDPGELRRFLDVVGVSEAEDLAELDEGDLLTISRHLKKTSLKKFNRFLCRDVSGHQSRVSPRLL